MYLMYEKAVGGSHSNFTRISLFLYFSSKPVANIANIYYDFTVKKFETKDNVSRITVYIANVVELLGK